MPPVTELRPLREAALMTQDELSRLSGVTVSTISRLENGLQSARPGTIRKLANALSVPPHALVRTSTEEGTGTAGAAVERRT